MVAGGIVVPQLGVELVLYPHHHHKDTEDDDHQEGEEATPVAQHSPRPTTCAIIHSNTINSIKSIN